MKIEEQVCSLEQAKKLEGLGVKIDTYFVWATFGTVSYVRPREIRNILPIYKEYLAPNVAELGVLLNLNTGFYMLTLGDKSTAEFKAKCTDYDYMHQEINGESEAQARTEALIWLIENKYTKVEDLKL